MKAKKIAYLGLLTALAMILSFVESQIPALVAIPGIKVGLPNIAIVFVLYKLGGKYAIGISAVRVFLVSLLFGNLQVFTFSMAGALLSMLGMILLKKTNWFSVIAVSILLQRNLAAEFKALKLILILIITLPNNSICFAGFRSY